ncbi:MAG: twitching motility protein PilT [Lachnospiraceae bacterium]|nr:twitching motility protein PilT [Sarcina sp.]MBQ6590255.1 twitching motility protein PilT [Lachnospiraceae bacterium]
MVHLITGNKGKGKTKWMLDKANTDIKDILGSICYLDKSAQHMYELNNRIRLVIVPDYNIDNCDQFLGFVSGIISQDHDLEQMYFDSFLKIAHLEGEDITKALLKLEKISKASGVNFYISVSLDDHEIPEELKDFITVAL